MDYSEYYKARKQIIEIMRDDLVGPVSEDEKLSESPVNYYLLGKLFPSNVLDIDEEDQSITENENAMSEEDAVALGNENYQSAMGYTFSVSNRTESFSVKVGAASYTYSEDERVWVRKYHSNNVLIDMKKLTESRKLSFEIYENLQLLVTYYYSKRALSNRITVTLVNRSVSKGYSYKVLSNNTYFQPELTVCNLCGGEFLPVVGINKIDDDREMELLYHENRTYATGHGCAVKTCEVDGVINEIQLQIMPEIELLQMKPSKIECGNIFSMKYLSEAKYEELADRLTAFCRLYESWIDETEHRAEELDEAYDECAAENIDKCRKTLAQIKDAIKLLADENVFKAFKYANRAMLLQKTHTSKGISEEQVTWYPFQLAFFLKEINSIVDEKSIDRNIVDLLWFPTGGGKTEAYLGIAAFTIFYRRIKAINDGIEDTGTSVIMRYTLRLLSLQQFERASAMICAAEMVRKEESLGEKPFGIGLWAGQSLTPNRLKDAMDYLSGNVAKGTNPVQIKKCPWCGGNIQGYNYHVDFKKTRMRITCNNITCDFKEGLPIYLVDEEIYEHKPSFVIGTVDKFAQIAYVEKAGELLGVGQKKSVDLIIQDELHLISGPLGTISGAYEAAFLKLMERNSVQPKIIASTATIKNAESQIKNLYGRNYSQFPPQGISINDSFLASQANNRDKASRIYIGLMAPGVSRSTTFNRVVASLLFATRYLKSAGYSEEVVDSFWTQTDYFNNLRELGTALTRIVDGVQDRYMYLANSKFADKYFIYDEIKRYDRAYEMTSRNSSSDLGEALQQQLQIPYKEDESTNPYDFLVASNMISVGVDISRLNTMVVVGQPLKSAEYIQSTSRVGRSTPGLVITVFSPSKSRDRSHYEQFWQYHSSLYKYVEATSLTPFADRARDRTLQAMYILLCRYSIKGLKANEGASRYRKDLPGVSDVRDYIMDYVREIDPQESEAVRNELLAIETEWEDLAKSNPELVYNDYADPDNSLFEKDYIEDSRFRMMGSMRNVEPEVEVITTE